MEDLSKIFNPVPELLRDKKLKEKDLLTKPTELKPEQSYPIDMGDVTFSIGMQEKLSVQLFNDENDEDPEGFISASASKPIQFNPASQAYLKYQFGLVPKANVSGTVNDLGFNLEASASVKTAYYKSHANTEIISQAFKTDISRIATIFKWKDIKDLAIGDAVSFQAGGTLSAGLKISWSNIFSQSMSALASTLPKPITLDIKLSPELAASFQITVSDEFSYFIKRVQANQLLISVSKIQKTDTNSSLGVSVSASLTSSDVTKPLNDLTDEVIQSITKYSKSAIDKAIEAGKNNSASSSQKTLLDEVARLFGLSGAADLPAKVEEQLKKLGDSLKDSIKKTAELNAKLSFTYQYERIQEDKELLLMEIPDDTLKSSHPKLLRFQLSEFLNLYIDGKLTGATLKSYINQTSLIIKKSWGFGLKLFGNELLKSKDFDTLKSTEETNALRIHNGHKKVNQQRGVGYSWKLGKGEGKWLTELNARMQNYSVGSDPLFSEVTLSWYLNMAVKDSRVNEDDLRRYLDMAVLWGAVQQRDVDAVVQKYLPAIKGKSATFESKLILSEFATRTIIQQAGAHQWNKTNEELLARSLAAALRYSADHPLRADVSAREEAYAPLWLDYLRDHNQVTRTLAAKAYERLRHLPHIDPMLLDREENAGNNNQGFCFADVVYTNPPFTACQLLIKGLSDLSSKINQNAPLANHFIDATSLLTATAEQSYFVRTLGSFLHRYAKQNSLLTKEVQRVFTITYQEGNAEQVINVSII